MAVEFNIAQAGSGKDGSVTVRKSITRERAASLNAQRQAVQLEREACAKIADQASMACRTDPGKNTADRIALKIRERQ